MNTAAMADAEKPIRMGVVILAAGASSRMGRPKVLLPWKGTSVMGCLLSQWRGLGAEQVGIVCDQANEAIFRELDRLEFPQHDRIVNPSPERGMFSSIQCAAAWKGWKKTVTHWAITLGDQPHVRPQTLRVLVDFAMLHPNCICQPSRDHRGRHPVILPAGPFGALRISREENLKRFLSLRSDEIARCEIDDPGLDLDMDMPADYEKALALASM